MIDLSLTDEQGEIVAAAAALLAQEAPVSRLRPGAAQPDVHLALAAWGWFGVGLPEADGGLGLSVADEALLYIEAGRVLLSPSILAASLAARMAAPALRADLLSGRRRAAMAMPAGDGRFYGFDRGEAEVLVTIDHELAGLYPADAFRGTPTSGLDESVTMETGRLDLDRRLAAEPGDRGVLLVAAMLAGIARASCDAAVAYAKVREQFGQPIGAFQAVKHRCADMAVQAYAAEAQVRLAATAARDDVEHAAFQIAAAARTAMTAARANGASAIQVHGGMGFTADCEAHLHLKRSHLLGQLIGGRAAQDAWLLACAAPGKG